MHQLAASKARNQTLSSQLKNAAAKNQPSTATSSSSLHQSSGSLSSRLPSAGSERGGSKGCSQCAKTKTMYEREMARKEKAVEDLKQQLRCCYLCTDDFKQHLGTRCVVCVCVCVCVCVVCVCVCVCVFQECGFARIVLSIASVTVLYSQYAHFTSLPLPPSPLPLPFLLQGGEG